MAKFISNQIPWGETKRPGLLLPLAVHEEGKGGASVIGEQGERGGEVERGGGWVMKRKEIARLLGDKGEGGVICFH